MIMTANISFDFSAIDEYSITIFIVGYVIVFSALIILSFLFQYLPKMIDFEKLELWGEVKPHHPVPQKEISKDKLEKNLKDGSIDDDYAAIAMAINLYLNDMHDDESLVITIDRERLLNSPWSSKIK